MAWFRIQDLPELDVFDRTRIDIALDDAAPAWFAPTWAELRLAASSPTDC